MIPLRTLHHRGVAAKSGPNENCMRALIDRVTFFQKLGRKVEQISHDLVALARKFLHSKQFLFWLDCILRLPTQSYNSSSQPTSIAEEDQKCWSYLTDIRRFGVPRDAQNKTYFCCVTMLAHMIWSPPHSWSRLSECRLSLPLANSYRSFLKMLCLLFMLVGVVMFCQLCWSIVCCISLHV